jgi:SEC-C motif
LLFLRERESSTRRRTHSAWLAIWEWPRVYLEAERHAVFAPADDSPWLDISPSPFAAITTRLFLPDDAAAEYDFANAEVREDNIREALAADDRITDLFRLAEQIHAQSNSRPGLGEIRLRISERQREQSSLIEALAMEYTPRNARCFCGSGKKFEKCHGLNAEGASQSHSNDLS